MRIRRGILDAMIEHARRDAPLECCGLLIGDEGSVLESRAARNLRRSAVSYLVDPADHFAAIRAARADGLSVVGAYHSHPATAPVPSPTDISEARDPDFLHVIVSVRSPQAEIGAFRIHAGRVTGVLFEPV